MSHLTPKLVLSPSFLFAHLTSLPLYCSSPPHPFSLPSLLCLTFTLLCRMWFGAPHRSMTRWPTSCMCCRCSPSTCSRTAWWPRWIPRIRWGLWQCRVQKGTNEGMEKWGDGERVKMGSQYNQSQNFGKIFGIFFRRFKVSCQSVWKISISSAWVGWLEYGYVCITVN